MLKRIVLVFVCFRPNRVTIYERREGGSGVIEEILKVLSEVRWL